MQIKVRLTLLFFSSILFIFTTSCSSSVFAGIDNLSSRSSLTPSITPSATATPFQAMTDTPVIIPATYTPTTTFTPSLTFTPSATFTPLPTQTPIPTETPLFVWNPGGYVLAPILLYHHVSDSGAGNRYYVTVSQFRSQMEALRDWGYTTITPSVLVDVLINGGELPNKPILITFDDGNYDVYQNAFPIMRELGFVGAFYIVGNRLHSTNYVEAEQLNEMIAAGWEIGSHGMTHSDLTLDHSSAYYEMVDSRVILQNATDEQILTYAYAYGKTDGFISAKASEYGYRAGMGLGMSWEHTLYSLFFLNRREVQGDYSLSNFAGLLP